MYDIISLRVYFYLHRDSTIITAQSQRDAANGRPCLLPIESSTPCQSHATSSSSTGRPTQSSSRILEETAIMEVDEMDNQ